jgi:type II secretory pathway component GspD/PulD (secretin)
MKRILNVSFLTVFVMALCASVRAEEVPWYGKERISLKIRDKDIVEVLEFIADKAEISMSISPNVKQKTTLFLKDVTLAQALDTVIVSGDLAYEKRGDIMFVMTSGDYEKRHSKKFSDERSMRIFKLKNVKADTVRDMLAQTVSAPGKIVADETTNTVVVFEKDQKLEEVSSMVEKLDRMPNANDLDVATMPMDKEAYYRQVMQKLRDAVPQWYFKGSAAQVKVKFTLSDKGELTGEPEVLTYSVNDYWKKLAAEVVRKAAPFSPFPPDMKDDTATFEIEIAL